MFRHIYEKFGVHRQVLAQFWTHTYGQQFDEQRPSPVPLCRHMLPDLFPAAAHKHGTLLLRVHQRTAFRNGLMFR